MRAGDGASWRFLPAGAPDADDLDAARAEGPAALGRALRATRATIGATRLAARLRLMEPKPGLPLRLLVAAPIQPKTLLDPLSVAFAQLGFDLVAETVEGFAALEQRAGADGAAEFVCILDPTSAPRPEPGLVALATHVAARFGAPTAIARFGAPTAEEPLAPGVDLLTVGLAIDAALDRRFAASFGTILRPVAADAFADSVAAWVARRTGRAPKLVVSDLDGTLWNGILGERAAGENGIAPPLNRAYAEALKVLAARGFVLAIASRNDPADVDAVFAAEAVRPLARQDFSALAVGWDDKAVLVAELLSELGLGADHTILIDDDPVNCAKVAARFPAMDVRLFSGDPDAFAAGLLADPLLLGGGAESGLRTARYRAKADVERWRREAPDVGSFLAALETRLTFLPLDRPNLARAAELASRVNQFVLRDLRPSVLDLDRRHSPFDMLVRLDDAFGSHGIVGLMLASADGDRLVLDNLYLSCRALERGVEDAMLSALAQKAEAAGLSGLTGRLDLLPRNAPARAFVARVASLAADGTFDYSPPEAGRACEEAPGIDGQDGQDGKGDAP